MRMWMLLPELLCKNHLLGSHSELHKHKHIFAKQQSIKGRIYPVIQIEPASMKKRHDELVKEMLRRGYKHNSPYTMPDISYLPLDQQNAKVDISESIKELKKRCPECRKLLKN